MYNRDLIERKSNLERRISCLEDRLQDKKMNDKLSENEPKYHERALSVDCTSRVSRKPPLQRKTQRQPLTEIQRLQNIVRQTVERQLFLEEQIVSLRNSLDQMNSQAGSRAISNCNGFSREGSYENNLINSHPNVLINQSKYQQKSKLPLQQLMRQFSFKQHQHQNSQDDQQYYELSPDKENKQLSIPKKKSKSILKIKTNIKQPKLSATLRQASNLPFSQQPKQIIQISTGTKKYIASNIIMRLNNRQDNSQKTKQRTSEQFNELIDKRYHLRETLIKKIIKLKKKKHK